MDIIEVIKAVADSSIGLVLALIVIYWIRNDTKEYAEREREDKLLLVRALQENTAAQTELIILLKRLNGSK